MRKERSEGCNRGKADGFHGCPTRPSRVRQKHTQRSQWHRLQVRLFIVSCVQWRVCCIRLPAEEQSGGGAKANLERQRNGADLLVLAFEGHSIIRPERVATLAQCISDC